MRNPIAASPKQRLRCRQTEMRVLCDARALIMADGPLTAVAALRATAAERAAACSPLQARRLIEKICRRAERGQRQGLLELGQLLLGQPVSFGLSRTATRTFAALVRDAVVDGRLLLIPGWPT